MTITAPQAGWAEQAPEQWWDNLKLALQELLNSTRINPSDIESIGISYQMHGLVLVDKQHEIIRPSIIWCDSRATGIGEKAMNEIGEHKCLANLLNSPGNFTASKLKWVQENEPDSYDRIHKIMLPGDYIAMKLSGAIQTTVSGLSEGILWNFQENKLGKLLLDYYGISERSHPRYRSHI